MQFGSLKVTGRGGAGRVGRDGANGLDSLPGPSFMALGNSGPTIPLRLLGDTEEIGVLVTINPKPTTSRTVTRDHSYS